MAAGRPDVIVLQHSPTRKEYDGFPGYPMHPIQKQIQAIELVSSKPVIAITLNHEGLTTEEIPRACKILEEKTGKPTCDVLIDGPQKIVEALLPFFKKLENE